MDYRQISRFIGLLLLLVAVSMIGCLGYALYDDEPGHAADRALGFSALLTAAAGGLLRWFGAGSSREILRREARGDATLAWVRCETERTDSLEARLGAGARVRNVNLESLYLAMVAEEHAPPEESSVEVRP